ncbi:MAG: RHS repeat protein, partial [Planctomycetes bacterium]|nr:RHS repeat protein [Planctomycetota bacterium]
MPVLNGIPSKHDPALVADNDLSSTGSCSSSSGTVSELSDEALYQDAGDPVGLHNGMVSYRVTDLFLPGRKLHFEFTRRYNSKFAPVNGQQGPVDGPLGYGWDHNFNLLIQSNDTRTSATLFNGNTRLDQYSRATPPGSGDTLNSPLGIYNRLFWGPPPGGGLDTFWTRGRHGSKVVFEFARYVPGTSPQVAEYRAKSIQDSNGNKQTLEYNATTGRLAKVWDALGRAVEFFYDDGANPHHITRVKDFTNREIVYDYSSGNLVSVRTPVTTPVTENGVVFNDFAAGRTERYTYSSGTGDPVLDHNLLTVQRPAEDGTTPPQPALAFSYYSSNTSSGFRDWCSSQTLGGGSGANAAGGTITYTYSTSSLPSGVALRTTVRDRRGNETDYSFDISGHATQIDERSGTTSTVLAATSLQYDSEGQITFVERPLHNTETRTYSTGAGLGPVARYAQGNLSSITITADARGTGGTSSNTIGVSFQWEPVFNHLCSRTDELSRTTEFVCDYMEGNPALAAPLIAAEMGISSTDAAAIAGMTGLLRNTDVNGDTLQNQIAGNVVEIVRPTVVLSSTGGSNIGQISREPNAQQEAIETFVYNPFGQMIARTDAEQNTSVFLYYPETKPFDGQTPSGSGTNNDTGGYLRQVDRDVILPYAASAQLNGVGVRNVSGDFGRDTNQNPPVVSAKTDFVYNPVGNLTAVVDPRGVRTAFEVNALNEVWKVTRASDVSAVPGRLGGIGGTAEDLTGQAFAYQQKRLFDANGRLAKAFVQNAGNNADAGQVPGYLETQYLYDILSDVRQIVQEVGTSGSTSTWQYAHDPNQNLVTLTAPEQNTVTYEFDARDQLTKVTRGSGNDKTVVSFVYDANGNRTEITDGLNHITHLEHDGFDRVKRVEDALTNRKEYTRDAASLVSMIEEKGWTDGTSGLFVSLRKSTFDYDARHRLIQTDVQDPQSALVDGSLTPNDGNKVSRRIDYDRLGRVTFQIEDDKVVYETRYDGLSRVLKTLQPDVGIDGTANTVDAHYDDNGNLVKVVETEEYPAGSTNPTRAFETFDVFDALDRRVSTTDNLGNTTRFEYDSRDNVILSTDAKGPSSGLMINGRPANDPGNATRYFHDGLDRLLQSEMDLNVGGISSGGLDLTNGYNPDGKVTLKQKWDLNGRLVEQTDDRKQTTKYVYDVADRLVEQWFA